MTHARTFTAAFLALSITGYICAQTVRCTTWNLEWFPNGSAHEASAEQQNERIKEAADVLRPISPDIVLLQEVAGLRRICPPRRSHRARNLSCGHLLCVQGAIPERLGETASRNLIQVSSASGVVRTVEINEWC